MYEGLYILSHNRLLKNAHAMDLVGIYKAPFECNYKEIVDSDINRPLRH